MDILPFPSEEAEVDNVLVNDRLSFLDDAAANSSPPQDLLLDKLVKLVVEPHTEVFPRGVAAAAAAPPPPPLARDKESLKEDSEALLSL